MCAIGLAIGPAFGCFRSLCEGGKAKWRSGGAPAVHSIAPLLSHADLQELLTSCTGQDRRPKTSTLQLPNRGPQLAPPEPLARLNSSHRCGCPSDQRSAARLCDLKMELWPSTPQSRPPPSRPPARPQASARQPCHAKRQRPRAPGRRGAGAAAAGGAAAAADLPGGRRACWRTHLCTLVILREL